MNWKSNSTEAVEENGQIHPGQEDVPVLLRAEIQYGEFVRETTVKVTVVKRNETPQEREKSKLSELLQRAQEEDPESEKSSCPQKLRAEKFPGKKIFRRLDGRFWRGLCCWRRQSFSSRTKTCMIWWRRKSGRNVEAIRKSCKS